MSWDWVCNSEWVTEWVCNSEWGLWVLYPLVVKKNTELCGWIYKILTKIQEWSLSDYKNFEPPAGALRVQWHEDTWRGLQPACVHPAKPWKGTEGDMVGGKERAWNGNSTDGTVRWRSVTKGSPLSAFSPSLHWGWSPGPSYYAPHHLEEGILRQGLAKLLNCLGWAQIYDPPSSLKGWHHRLVPPC